MKDGFVGAKRVHLKMDIKGCLRNNSDKDLKGMFQDDTGKDVPVEKAKEFLNECLSKGWKFIPVGDCDNFDYQKGCLGHKVEADANAHE